MGADGNLGIKVSHEPSFYPGILQRLVGILGASWVLRIHDGYVRQNIAPTILSASVHTSLRLLKKLEVSNRQSLKLYSSYIFRFILIRP